jgi:dienelactone hydrolase
MAEMFSRRRLLIAAGTTLLAGISRRRLPADEPDGPVGPVTADQWIRRGAAEAPLAMQFCGTTAAECRAWQAEFAAKLRSLLGRHAPPNGWKTVLQEAKDLEDHRREQCLLLAEGHPPLPVYLLLPRPRARRPRPGILAIHGHGEYGYHTVAGRDDLPGVEKAIQAANYDYGRQLVRRGYVVAVPCLTPFGPRLGRAEAYGKQDPCGDTFIRLQMLGKLLIAENLRDCLWALELLMRREEVEASRLGCVGLSYGGRMTMLTAALEKRIGVAVISGALNVMQERISKPYGCGAQIIPGLLNYGDVPEIAALIAPRPCLWEVGLRDGLISPQWADEALARIRRAYQALDAEDRLLVDRFDGRHQWHGEMAYPLLEKVLG